MKFSLTLAVAALASTAAAQGLFSLPKCAQNCATNAIPAKCGLLNFTCICTDQSFLNNMGCCVQAKCDKADQEKTLKAAAQICARGGVSSLPSTVGCTSTGTSGASATSGAPTTTTASATTTSGTGMGSSSASATSTSSSASSSSTASSAAASATGGAVLGQHKDSSLMAAAGAAAAFAILV